LKSLYVFVLILFQASFIFAQRNLQQPQAYSPQLTAELKQLQEAALKSDYAWDQLAHLTNNIGPRPAGSAQANFHDQYFAAELRKLRLYLKM
jgi:carboxypeptidase Q